MAHTHKHCYLHQLLEEDQEPFLLTNYIADYRSQLKLKGRPISNSFPPNKRKPTIQSSICFLSFHSPDARKSPLVDFLRPDTAKARSPCKSPNSVPLCVPARAAALLLEAAMRIQKRSSYLKPNNRTKNEGFGFLGSVLRRLIGGNGSRNRGIGGGGVGVSAAKSAAKSEEVQEIDDSREGESTQMMNIAEEEEETEQFSPVSVLDPPPFEDDTVGGGYADGNEEDDYDLECNYAFLQRAKQQLLDKLLRFEKLAELDPIELEKRMLVEEEDDDDANGEDLEEEEGEEECDDGFFGEVLPDMKRRLVLHLIDEEKREEGEIDDDGEVVVRSVCKTSDSWKKAESHYSINMMVELDFRRELEGWKTNYQEQVGEAAMEIELAIFDSLLVDEFLEELCFTGPKWRDF